MKIRGAPTCCRVKPERQGRHRHRQIRGAPSARALLPQKRHCRHRPAQSCGGPSAGRNNFLGWKDSEATIPGGPKCSSHTYFATQQYGKGHILWGAIFPLRDCPPRHFPVPSRPPPPRPEFPGQVSRPAARPTASSVPGAAVLPQTPTAPTLDKPLLQLSSPRHALHLVARRTRYQGNGVTLARPRADLATLHFS